MADTTTTTSASGAPQAYPLTSWQAIGEPLTFLSLLFMVMYFVMIRPQQKRLSEHKALIASLKKGDRVITGGGVIGVIAKVENVDVVLVEIAPGVKVNIARSTIQEVIALENNTMSVAKTANDN